MRSGTVDGPGPAGERGQPFGARFPIRDKKGRSPSEQVKEPVSLLSQWLSTNKRGTPITPVVLLSHPSARIGTLEHPTVRVERSVSSLLTLIERSKHTLDGGRRTDIERLIRRDHGFHNARRSNRGQKPTDPSSAQHGR
jgi:hypothetical protein